MSSTNRGAERSPRDFYATPAHAYELLDTILPEGEEVYFWEPACGDGRIVKWLNSTGRAAGGTDIHENPCGNPCDFFADRTTRGFIITNPPFSLGVEFVQHALDVADEVLMLLPLNFAGSKKRHFWFRENSPSAHFVLSERPDFSGQGGDSIDYAWWYWGTRWHGMYWPSPAKPWKLAEHPKFLLWPPVIKELDL